MCISWRENWLMKIKISKSKNIQSPSIHKLRNGTEPLPEIHTENNELITLSFMGCALNYEFNLNLFEAEWLRQNQSQMPNDDAKKMRNRIKVWLRTNNPNHG